MKFFQFLQILNEIQEEFERKLISICSKCIMTISFQLLCHCAERQGMVQSAEVIFDTTKSTAWSIEPYFPCLFV